MSTHHIPFNNTAEHDRIAGVTTRWGRGFPFVEPASITNDALYAVGREGQVILPTDSIAQIWNHKFSAVRTVGLVGGLSIRERAREGHAPLPFSHDTTGVAPRNSTAQDIGADA